MSRVSRRRSNGTIIIMPGPATDEDEATAEDEEVVEEGESMKHDNQFDRLEARIT